MIPDKIYITEYNANVQTGYFSRNQDDVFTEEYIRKDTLIEWINKNIDSLGRLSYGEFIDKLNSI